MTVVLKNVCITILSWTLSWKRSQANDGTIESGEQGRRHTKPAPPKNPNKQMHMRRKGGSISTVVLVNTKTVSEADEGLAFCLALDRQETGENVRNMLTQRVEQGHPVDQVNERIHAC